MRAAMLGLGVVGLVLASCGRVPSPSPSGPRAQGRYAGIGTFDAGRLWAQTTGAPSAPDPASARLDDDEHIIVVIDTHTGEVRQCGDHSGFCVTMNPWAAEGARVLLPAKLGKHGSDLDAEAAAEAEKSEKGSKAPAK